MKKVLNKAKKALQELHREYLMEAFHREDDEYIHAMNGIFRVIERLMGDCE